MDIDNRSDISTEVLKDLIRFLIPRCKFTFMTRLCVLQRVANLPFIIQGASLKNSSFDIEPSVVTLSVGPKLDYYPARTKHEFVTEIGWIGFRSMEEELLFVMAHEFRHIEQMWGNQGPNPAVDVYASELDAEAFGLKMLYAYQQAQREALAA